MQRFLGVLEQLGLDLDGDAIADALWLATHIAPGDAIAAEPKQPTPPPPQNREQPGQGVEPTPPELPAVPTAQVSLPPSVTSSSRSAASASGGGVPFQAPAAPALRKSLELGRSLRPLMRKVPSRCLQVLDEEATALQIAESRGQRQWVPVFQPARERWLNLALVVEQTHFTMIWQELIAEFQTLLERQGAFRTIRTWSLRSSDSNLPSPTSLELLSQQSGARPIPSGHARSAKELLDPTGQQLVLMVSDCVSPAWQTGKIHPLLQQWAKAGPTAIVQLLPERLWHRSALGRGLSAQLRALLPGVASPQLQVTELPVWESVNLGTALTLPVVTLEPESLGQWAQVVAGMGQAQTAGVVFERELLDRAVELTPAPEPETPTPEELVQQFRLTASPLARRLAGLMSIVPVSLPVIHLIQEVVLPASRQVHVAEIFMGGLVQALPVDSSTEREVGVERVQYEFVSGVRKLLRASVPKTDTLTVLDKVSQYIAERAGLSIKSFAALLTLNPTQEEGLDSQEVRRFAELALGVLRQLGDEWVELVDELLGNITTQVEATGDLTLEQISPAREELSEASFSESESPAKLAVLEISTGNFETGFAVRLQVGEEGAPSLIVLHGHLPPAPAVLSCYESWRMGYYQTVSSSTRQRSNLKLLASELEQALNEWLDSGKFFQKIRDQLLKMFSNQEPVRLIIQTDQQKLWQLPWEVWHLVQEHPNVDVALSKRGSALVQSVEINRSTVRILAFLGDSGDLELLRRYLSPEAELYALTQVERSQISDDLWTQPWDILFIAGFSFSRSGESFYQPPDMREALNNLISHGLKLAIFNSDDGVRLAQDLADLQLPATIVMRESISDEAAQEFLSYFLAAFAKEGRSLYAAVKQARQRLQVLEDKYPCVGWMPVIWVK